MDQQRNVTFSCDSPTDVGTMFQTIIMIIEMIVGLPANILALWIFCFHNKSWKPHTLFLLNMVLADFLLLASVPMRIDAELRGNFWVFGPVWCRVNLFMLAINRSASIAFMTAVALNRYFKVVHPFHCISHMTAAQAGCVSGLMWMVVVAVRLPLLTSDLLQQQENVSLCRSFNTYSVVPVGMQVHYVAFAAEVILPWLLLLFCSAGITWHLHTHWLGNKRRARKAIIAVGVISLVFTVCFMPSLLSGLGVLLVKCLYPDACRSYSVLTQLFSVSIGFTYLNSALDPVIYTFSSSMFQDALRSILSRLCGRRNLERTQTQ